MSEPIDKLTVCPKHGKIGVGAKVPLTISFQMGKHQRNYCFLCFIEFLDQHVERARILEKIDPEKQEEAGPPQPGEYYRHFKGNLYEIVAVSRHSEDKDLMLVTYRETHKIPAPQCWTRPLDMFMEKVEFEGKNIPRFRLYVPAD